MARPIREQLVYTVKDKCRVCYTCVRECPVKAIKIYNGQAEVINERCIGCGNCTRVCSQGAKVFLKTINEVNDILNEDNLVVACVAPSFAAEFHEISDYRIFVGMLRELGFNYVVEVAFGADIVAKAYSKLLQEKSKSYISSDCPAIVFYIQQYYPNLVSNLAPIASPVMAMSRVVKAKYGQNVKIVLIGPCVAKKAESNDTDEVITFVELRKLFADKNIIAEEVIPSDFDPPKAGKGAVFPINRGLIQTAGLSEDIYEGNIIIAEGQNDFKEAIKEFESGLIDKQHLLLLCCEGCIMGPGMSNNGKRYPRTKSITNYLKEKFRNFDKLEWVNDLETFSDIDLSQCFEIYDRRVPIPSKEEINATLLLMGKTFPSDHLNCGACGYSSCEEHAVAIIAGFAESEMCLPYAIEKLHKSVKDLNISKVKLESAREALKQSEKLATMGQLSAGIAHELNNPLGIITMYSNILKDESDPEDPICKDLNLIVEQADRCKKIVSGLLNFARKNKVNYSEVDIIQFVKHSIALVVVNKDIKIVFHQNVKKPLALIDKDQMMQVLTNLEKNAIDAMPNGGELRILLSDTEEEITFNICDNGSGISEDNMEKIFTPFFTTKDSGKGTGLGLPIIYGIVKMHNGRISVTSNALPEKGPTGTTFTISLPREKL